MARKLVISILGAILVGVAAFLVGLRMNFHPEITVDELLKGVHKAPKKR
jgi:hypothetical protein